MVFIQLLHVFFVALSVYFVVAILSSLALLALGIVLFVRRKRTALLLLPLALLAGQRTAYASCTYSEWWNSVIPSCVPAVKPITDKEFAKEVEGIVRQDRIDIGEYQYRVPPNVTATEASLYVTLVEADLTLVSNRLHLFKKHKATRADVDQVLDQLLRDLENAPGTDDQDLTL